MRRFQQNIATAGRDGRIRSAHHPGQRDGLFAVGDDEAIGSQRDGLSVQKIDRFARAREANDDSGFDFGEIESVQRLPAFEHHIIGDIDRGVDRAHAATKKTRSDGRRSRARQVDAAHDNAAEKRAGAARGGRDFDRHSLAVGVQCARSAAVPSGERFALRADPFAGDAEMTEPIAAIRRDRKIQNRIVQAQQIVDGFARAQTPRLAPQIQHARAFRLQAQLGGGANHARGFDAANRARADFDRAQPRPRRRISDAHADGGVGRAANDRRHIAPAAGDAADFQVGARMRSGGFDFGRDDSGRGRERRFGFDFEPARGQ